VTNTPSVYLADCYHISVDQSSREADSCSAGQIPRPLWNLKVHYRVHRNLPLWTLSWALLFQKLCLWPVKIQNASLDCDRTSRMGVAPWQDVCSYIKYNTTQRGADISDVSCGIRTHDPRFRTMLHRTHLEARSHFDWFIWSELHHEIVSY